jgi:hypothetical protein
MTKIGFGVLIAALLFVPLFAETRWPEARRIARAEARQARMETLRETAWVRREAREARMDAQYAMTQARAAAAREMREARQSAAEARRTARQYRQRWF